MVILGSSLLDTLFTNSNEHGVKGVAGLVGEDGFLWLLLEDILNVLATKVLLNFSI